MNTQAQAGGTPDLLSSIMGVAVRNEEKIAAEDREFCETRQERLYTTLCQLRWWYGLFTANAERYRESHNVIYAENGSIEKHKLRSIYHNGEREDYTEFEFLPFDSIDDVVKLYGKAVEAFGNDIVRHFNKKYGVSVPEPYFDDEKFFMGFLPEYQTYVDQVIGHLGGKGFRETAEEELLKRFHKIVARGYGGKLKAELKGDRITFPDLLYFDPFYWDLNKTNHLHYNYTNELNRLCEGIGFGVAGVLSGSSRNILCFDSHKVDTSEWYPFGIGDGIAFKFFKNGRLNVKFKDAVAAERCWKKLRLDTFKTQVDDE
ncbi:MAG: hypothetical protein LBU98_03890 [Alistipes sp.]|jgi:hypothetical protein|nr:hypothetical protein [Alistipes sp.]